MAREVFFSFHHQPDFWRVRTIRDIDTIKGNRPSRDSEWEAITRQGDKAIATWIEEQMSGRSCAIVFVGANTAQRKWIDYEIERAWARKMGVFGIHIHRLQNSQKQSTTKGFNPFSRLTFPNFPASTIPCHDPAGFNSASIFNTIASNIETWIDEANALRATY